MVVQRFEPMTKNFATFDCDAHVAEPPRLWERAKDSLTRRELNALQQTMWFESESRQLIVNGLAGLGATSQSVGGTAGKINNVSVAGPGLKHDIQRAFHVRNLRRETALTREQAAYINH